MLSSRSCFFPPTSFCRDQTPRSRAIKRALRQLGPNRIMREIKPSRRLFDAAQLRRDHDFVSRHRAGSMQAFHHQDLPITGDAGTHYRRVVGYGRRLVWQPCRTRSKSNAWLSAGHFVHDVIPIRIGVQDRRAYGQTTNCGIQVCFPNNPWLRDSAKEPRKPSKSLRSNFTVIHWRIHRSMFAYKPSLSLALRSTSRETHSRSKRERSTQQLRASPHGPRLRCRRLRSYRSSSR